MINKLLLKKIETITHTSFATVATVAPNLL
jgi:hypothetical protein